MESQVRCSTQEFGLSQSQMEPYLYHIYVDDFLIFWNDEPMLSDLKKFLMTNFKMKDLGIAEYCLGIRITRQTLA